MLAQDVPYLNGVYSGDTEKGVPHGSGTYTCESYTYTGDFKNGKMDGQGQIEDFNNQIVYIGEMKEG